MTTVAQIIQDAFRASNLVAAEVSPTTNEQTEGLRYLNRIVKSVMGNEAGEAFTNIPVGSNNIDRPYGYPWYNTVPDNNWFVPENVRVMVNIEAPLGLWLHPDPDDGCRFALIDVTGNLSTNNVTINANGRNIEGSNTLTLDTDGANFEWFYRGDLGSWQRYSSLELDDTFPFPEEFEDYFVLLLAMRLNPSYGKTLAAENAEMLRRSKRQLQARYDQDIFAPSERALLRLSRLAADRDALSDDYGIYDPTNLFLKGYPF